MRLVYLVLVCVVALAVFAELLFQRFDLVDRFAPNIATESMGILFTVALVQRYLERQERAHRLRGSIGALRKGSRALQRLAAAWAVLVKGTLPRLPESTARGVLDLFEPHYTEHLTHCNPGVLRAREDGEGTESWVRWAAREVTESCDLLNQIIIAYSASLDPAYVEVIDEVVDDPFVRHFGALAAAPPDYREWRVQMNAGRALREGHFSRLAAAITLHNKLARDAAAVRTRRMAPRTGSVGMELPLDHDLRVDLELSKRWWNTLPRVGGLRGELERQFG